MNNIKKDLINFSNNRPTASENNCIFTDYNDYIRWQVENGLSFESDNYTWSQGQERYIIKNFEHVDKSSKIIDICCGDGVGLNVFKKLQFTNITGIEICDEKIARARASGFNVEKKDICCEEFNVENEYDIVYTSHTLEHVLKNPQFTIKNLCKILKPNGKMYVVLPFPELKGGDSKNVHNFMVHCGVIPLNLHIQGDGSATVNIFTQCGLSLIDIKTDDFREPELWMIFKKL